MNKKGFTLVELMAAIVILGVLMGVAVPNVLSIYKNMKIKYFCEKVSTIEQAATLYGQDKYGEEVTTNSNELSLAKVSVLDLVKAGYIKKDDLSIGEIELISIDRFSDTYQEDIDNLKALKPKYLTPYRLDIVFSAKKLAISVLN